MPVVLVLAQDLIAMHLGLNSSVSVFCRGKHLEFLPVTPPLYRTGHPFLPHEHHTVNFRFLLHQIEYEFGVAFVTHQLSLQPRITPHKLKKGRFPEKKKKKLEGGRECRGKEGRRGEGKAEKRKRKERIGGGGVGRGWKERSRWLKEIQNSLAQESLSLSFQYETANISEADFRQWPISITNKKSKAHCFSPNVLHSSAIVSSMIISSIFLFHTNRNIASPKWDAFPLFTLSDPLFFSLFALYLAMRSALIFSQYTFSASPAH